MDWSQLVIMLSQVDWIQVFTVIVTMLFFISELLGNIPQVKSNSVYQVFTLVTKEILKALKKSKNGEGYGKRSHSSDEKTV